MTDSKSKSRGKPRPSEHAGRRTPEIIFSNSNTESGAEADSETETESESKSQSQSESESELSESQPQSESESNNEGDSDDSEPARPVIDVSPRRQTSRRAVAPEHGQILVSALLETWVKTMYYNASPADQKRLFGQFVYHMGALGVNFGDTASDDFAEARKHYLASAEQFGKQILRGNPRNVQQFMENTLVRARRGSLASLEDVKRTSTLQAQDPGFLPATPTYIRPSILKEDYIEYEVLGKGSFGLVTKVVHKLDRSEYALKKVRLTTTSLRINGRGDVELGWRRILKEVRTLAKLDHSNIVRYYSSWIEDGNVVQTPTAVPQLDDSEEEEVSNDRPVGPPFPKGWPNVIYDPDKEAPPPLPRRRCIMNLNKPSKLDLQLAVANEDKEGALVPQTPMTQSRFAEPNNLTLHIVMALYNMSLKDFLVKRMDLEDGCAPAVRHCFCPRASLEILQAMVDGVEYLHENGITHRDLKPANVMLQVQDKSRRIACCEKGGFSVIPKISDFGTYPTFASMRAFTDGDCRSDRKL